MTETKHQVMPQQEPDETQCAKPLPTQDETPPDRALELVRALQEKVATKRATTGELEMSDDEQLISEDQWSERFGWACDADGNSELLEDTPTIRMLLRRIGREYVWSQQDRDDGGYEIVPGMTGQAIGFYLCVKPRTTPEDENIVGVIPPADNYEE